MLRWSWIKAPEQKRIYLDYAAATPVRPRILALMSKVTEGLYANPSAIHKEGVAARELIEESRLRLARLLKIRPRGVVFTASGTESNNLALYGLVRKLHESGREFSDMTIISTKLEHPSVSEVLDHLEEIGVKVKFVEVDEEGLIDLNNLEELLDDTVVLVTFAYVNSEVGVVQEVSRISRLVKKFNQAKGTDIKVHTDAAQAPLWLPCQLEGLGVDLLSLDAGKCYGPKGVGVLAMRHNVKLSPITLGGGQEHGLRAATENTPAVVGAVEALLEAQEKYETRAEKISKLRDQMIKKIQMIDGTLVNGSLVNRVANNINISVSGVDGEFAVVSLDEAGIAVSTKSACSGAGGGGSVVVETIYSDVARAKSTIRVTLGEDTNVIELSRLVNALKRHVDETRNAHKALTQT